MHKFPVDKHLQYISFPCTTIVNSHRHDYRHPYNKFHLVRQLTSENQRFLLRGFVWQYTLFTAHVTVGFTEINKQWSLCFLYGPWKWPSLVLSDYKKLLKRPNLVTWPFMGVLKNTKFSYQAQYFNLFVPIFLLWKDQLKLLVPIFWI